MLGDSLSRSILEIFGFRHPESEVRGDGDLTGVGGRGASRRLRHRGRSRGERSLLRGHRPVPRGRLHHVGAAGRGSSPRQQRIVCAADERTYEALMSGIGEQFQSARLDPPVR